MQEAGNRAPPIAARRHRLIGLLTVENPYQTALLALVQARAARYADTADVFQALRGVWCNRSDIQS